MQEIIDKLLMLKARSSQVTLYNADLKTVMKGIGRVIGKFDTELLAFLKLTNGVSIFDYCFMGFKNAELGVDIDKYALEIGLVNNRLAGHFMPFMSTSTGDDFGYLMDIVDEKGRHPIGYYNREHQQDIHILASSFGVFMKTFLADVEDTLNRNDCLIMSIEKDEWPADANHWLANDGALRQNKTKYQTDMKVHMPDTNFF